jgi:hypothetical protein
MARRASAVSAWGLTPSTSAQLNLAPARLQISASADCSVRAMANRAAHCGTAAPPRAHLLTCRAVTPASRANAAWLRLALSRCGFQRIAARHSDLIAATIPI